MHRINTSRSVDCLNHSQCIFIYLQIMQCSKQVDEDIKQNKGHIKTNKTPGKAGKKLYYYFM